MMKALVVALGLVFVPGLIAQEQEPATPAEEPRQTTGSANASPAPKPGHPLDPADVDVLTGKDRARKNPYGVYGYGGPGSMYGYGYGTSSSPSIAADVTTRTSSPVSLAFSRGRTVIVIGNAPFGTFLRGPRVCSRGVFGRGGLF
jgi:hypothetical protein